MTQQTANRAAAANRTPGSGGTNRLPLILAIVVGLCAAIAIGVTVASGGDDGGGGTSVAAGGNDGTEEGPIEDRAEDVTVTGAALDAYIESVDDLAVGKEMPALSGTGLDGAPLTIGPDDGPAVVAFVSHWCPHCQKEVPVIVDWLAGGGGEGVNMRAVSTSFNPDAGNWPSSEWLAREEWPVPTLLDPAGDAALAVGLGEFPYFVAINSSGQVVGRVVGELEPDQLDTLAAIAAGEA